MTEDQNPANGDEYLSAEPVWMTIDDIDPAQYEPYEPADNPDGLIRELRIPLEMVVDMSRPKIIAAKPPKSESALRMMCAVCIILLVVAATTVLQAGPRAISPFWYTITDSKPINTIFWNINMLRLANFLNAVNIGVCGLGLLILLRNRKRVVPRMIILCTAALLSAALIAYVSTI